MITPATMSVPDMEQAAQDGYLCAVCQGRIVVAWGGSYGVNDYILKCGNNIGHEGITRHDKSFEKKIREVKSMESTALMAMDETKMMARVEMARFPQELTHQDKRLLAQVAITYGFDPLMSEVSIYQGRPYVSIDGRYRKAQETGRLSGVSSRPATEQEREDWQIPAGDYFFRAEVMVKGAAFPFVGWGRVYGAETQGGKGFKPVEKNPQRMAEKRAEAQALRKAFHIPLPSIEDIGSPEDIIDVTAVKQPQRLPEPPSPQSALQAPATETQPESQVKAGYIDLEWLRSSLLELQWVDAGKYLKNKYKVTGAKVSEMAAALTKEQSAEFVKEIADRLEGQISGG